MHSETKFSFLMLCHQMGCGSHEMDNFSLIGSGLYIRPEDISYWHENRWNGQGRILSSDQMPHVCMLNEFFFSILYATLRFKRILNVLCFI